MEKTIELKGIKYIVSTDGRIFSTSNIGRGKYHKELSYHLNKDGYLRVTVGRNKERTPRYVHRIIAEAFVPNPEHLPEVDHKDNNKLNNHVSNLQWITGFDNKSKIPFATRSECRKGERNGRAILTLPDVQHIRHLYRQGATISEIAKLYHRGWSTINNIVKNLTWRTT